MSWLFIRRPVIHFYHAEADAVSLVIDGFSVPLPMTKNGSDNWTIKLPLPLHELQGRAYHFLVQHNNTTTTVADPLAHRTQRHEHGLVSFFSDIAYRWQHPRFKAPPLQDIVIYESHLPALSRHSSAKVEDESHRGTYTGARSQAVLNHLQRLNVAVEFLPLHAHDQFLGQDWGYFSTSFHAMRECYAVKKDEVNREVMALVDTMHGRGIPVLLDVVFNHGGELWVKAWGQDIVYRKHDNGDFCHGSGCGPTLRTEHPLIRETMIKTLEHLVNTYRFDGFRFDLGALHDKETILEIDRRLPKRIYLIAEPWALGGAQWGKGDMSGIFSSTRWAVWNDDFREAGKTFIKGRGDHHNRDRLMCAIKGSHIGDGGWAQRPQQCINYLSSHDGKTLADQVRGSKQRVFLGAMLVLTSQGVPMLGEGTELMFSKHGHDNSYNRPDLNQIDWNNARQYKDLIEAIAHLIALRKQMPHFCYTSHLKQRNGCGNKWDIDWIFPTGHPHHDNVNAIGFILRPPPRWFTPLIPWLRNRQKLVILLNGSERGVDFHLPKGNWKVVADGYRPEVNARGIPGIPHAHSDYHTHPGTGVLLARA
jgi:pullulanase/glycogen debranching enzyme